MATPVQCLFRASQCQGAFVDSRPTFFRRAPHAAVLGQPGPRAVGEGAPTHPASPRMDAQARSAVTWRIRRAAGWCIVATGAFVLLRDAAGIVARAAMS